MALAAGAHTVRFHYRDPSVRAGLTLTLVGLVLVAVLLAAPGGASRRGAEAGERADR